MNFHRKQLRHRRYDVNRFRFPAAKIAWENTAIDHKHLFVSGMWYTSNWTAWDLFGFLLHFLAMHYQGRAASHCAWYWRVRCFGRIVVHFGVCLKKLPFCFTFTEFWGDCITKNSFWSNWLAERSTFSLFNSLLVVCNMVNFFRASFWWRHVGSFN